MNKLSHINTKGEVQMVDVSSKDVTTREASAFASISLKKSTIELIKANANKKGDVITTAKIAGIQGAKKCYDLIPLCHQLILSNIDIDIIIDEEGLQINIISTVKTNAKTGVEMEALTAVSIAALTIYDMCKATDRFMVVNNIHMRTKTGGKSGNWKYEKIAK